MQQEENLPRLGRIKDESETGGSGWLLYGMLGIAFFLALVYNLLILEQLFVWDAWDAIWPWFSYLATSISTGRFPLWDPHSSCGFPFWANPQGGQYYPVYILAALYLGGSYKVFQYIWLGHWLFGFTGFFLLMKRMGIWPLPALAASVAFAFNGFFLGNAEHTTFILPICYFPWILLAIDVAYLDNLYYSAVAGVLLGLAGLAGTPGIMSYFVIMLFLWCFLKYRASVRTALMVLVMAAVGAVILSPPYAAFLVEAHSYTHRSDPLPVITACHSQRFPIAALVSLLVPRFTVAYQHFLECDVSMTNGYFGILGITSLFMILFLGQLRKMWRWLLAWMGIAFLFSLGTEGGIRIAAYYVLPTLNYMRHSSIFRAFWLFGGATLLGLALGKVLVADNAEKRTITSLYIKVLLLALYICSCILLWALVVPDRAWMTIASIGVQIGIVSLYIILFYLYGKGTLTGRLFAVTILIVTLADFATHLYSNQWTVARGGVFVVMAPTLDQLGESTKNAVFTGSEKRIWMPRSHLNIGMFDRKFYIMSYNAAASAEYDFLVGGTLVDRSNCLRTPFSEFLENSPRFWLTPTLAFADEKDCKALEIIRDSGSNSLFPIFIHTKSAELSGGGRGPVVPGTYGRVRVLKYEPEKVELSIDSPEQSWLFSAERYSASWRALVDGHETKIQKANFCFRVIKIPKGEHIVTMVYTPWIYKPLLVLSWSLIFVVLCLWPLQPYWRQVAGWESISRISSIVRMS
ncbi:MAG: YfhO family protein [Desulfomonilaceae bacterium]